jgi:hypothetical protein
MTNKPEGRTPLSATVHGQDTKIELHEDDGLILLRLEDKEVHITADMARLLSAEMTVLADKLQPN